MDPNACLEEMLRAAKRITENGMEEAADKPEQDQTDADFIGDADRLAELVLAMDGWLTKGGFLPARWEVKRG